MMLRAHGGAVGVSTSNHYTSVHLPIRSHQMATNKLVTRVVLVACSSALQTSPVAADENKQVKPAAPKPKAAAKPKAPAKTLPQMMEEDIIPSLKSILEAQQDLTDLQLSFQDNRLEGSFVKEGIPYVFWAFFPTGSLTGPKGFSLSSYGLEPSSVEPFLVDEKKITDRHVVFWVEKRLAAQGIIPVWKDT